MACSNMSTCPMYPIFSMQSLLYIWKSKYCEADFETCARFQARQRGESVPPNLLPNGSVLNTPSARKAQTKG